MNSLFKDKLAIITEDELLLKVIREVFDERIKKELPKAEGTDDNILLGEKYRAYDAAKQIVKKAFIDLMSYERYEKNTTSFNKGK